MLISSIKLSIYLVSSHQSTRRIQNTLRYVFSKILMQSVSVIRVEVDINWVNFSVVYPFSSFRLPFQVAGHPLEPRPPRGRPPDLRCNQTVSKLISDASKAVAKNGGQIQIFRVCGVGWGVHIKICGDGGSHIKILSVRRWNTNTNSKRYRE